MATVFAILGVALPGAASAAPGDPDSVAFTNLGCRYAAGQVLPNADGKYICPDGQYTSGNLGKGWNELDLVPYRLVADSGNSAPSTQTYTISTVLDGLDGSAPGYDVISAPVLNTALSAASCQEATSTAQTDLTPGLGGIDKSIYRKVTITQAKNTTCVYDWYGRLALGSHLFPGSSLHSNLANQNQGTAGIGSKEVSIPVKEILPQELTKDMSASKAVAYSWNVTKAPTPTVINFDDSCATADGASAGVQIKVEWKKVASAGGGVQYITNIYAKNPAARTITVNVTDKVYEGTAQTTLLDSKTFAPVDVPANTTQLIGSHAGSVATGATQLNDVATATYTDKVTGIAVPGNTTANASTTISTSSTNTTAIITDVEKLTGDDDNHLSFSIDSTDNALLGSFGGYTLGTKTRGPVTWTSNPVSTDGSITFDKTVYLDGPANTSASLDDTATATGSDGFKASASASVSLSAAATSKLTINKTIPDVLTGGETQTFTFHVKNASDVEVATPTITFAAGQTAKSVDVPGLTPGAGYTVSEDKAAGFDAQPSQTVDLSLPGGCSKSVTFNNTIPAATAKVHKTTVPAGSGEGWDMTLKGGNLPAGGITQTTDANGDADFGVDLAEGSYTVTETAKDGWKQTGSSGCSFTVDYPKDAGQTFTCAFTNTKLATAKAHKTTVPAGSEAGWELTLKGTGLPADGITKTTDASGDVDFGVNLDEGSYTITEKLKDGWKQTGKSGCEFTVTFPGDAGKTFNCSFTNTKLATVKAHKTTVPAGSEAGWELTLKGTGLPADGITKTTDAKGDVDFGVTLDAGSYTITEKGKDGWKQTGKSGCEFTVTFPADAGKQFSCTFTNTKLATAKVHKTTVPAGSQQGWEMTLKGPGLPAGGITKTTDANGDADFGVYLDEGHYTVTEKGKAGWQQASAVGCEFDVAFPGDAGKTFKCSFTNTQLAVANVVKTTVPGGSEEGWMMTLHKPDGSTVKATTDADGKVAFGPLADQGDYTITETLKEGWKQTGNTGCSFTVSYPADANKTFTCQLENTKLKPGIDVEKTERRGSSGDFVDGPITVHVGDTVEYKLVVKNTGESPLAVTISDPKCDSAPTGPTGDTNDNGKLDLTETWTYLCSHKVTAADGTLVHNVVTAEGKDSFGDKVSDKDSADAKPITPGIDVVKAGPAFAYHGDTVHFTFTVTNSGNTPLSSVNVKDDHCDVGTTPESRSNDDGDNLLENPGSDGKTSEVWVFGCDYKIADHASGEENPVHNTATASGSDSLGQTVTDKDSHDTKILHPAVHIEKTGPATAKQGDRVPYTLAVTNPGDVPLVGQTLAVTDPQCDAPPVLVGKATGSAADATPDWLDPGDTWVYTCSVQTTTATALIDNVANVKGNDANGKVVTDSDNAQTALAAVLAEVIDSGAAKLTGPSSCVKKNFAFKVTGKHIKKVVFKIDGKTVKTKAFSKGNGKKITFKVNPKKYGSGLHKLTARVTYNAANKTAPKTLRAVFEKCKKLVVKPQFTG